MAKKFVIHQHSRTGKANHLDLMLETDKKLETYRLNSQISQLQHCKTPAERISDHDPKFLTYQGPVNNNTGFVKLLDQGNYEVLCREENKIRLSLSGEIIFGIFEFCQSSSSQWFFSKI